MVTMMQKCTSAIYLFLQHGCYKPWWNIPHHLCSSLVDLSPLAFPHQLSSFLPLHQNHNTFFCCHMEMDRQCHIRLKAFGYVIIAIFHEECLTWTILVLLTDCCSTVNTLTALWRISNFQLSKAQGAIFSSQINRTTSPFVVIWKWRFNVTNSYNIALCCNLIVSLFNSISNLNHFCVPDILWWNSQHPHHNNLLGLLLAAYPCPLSNYLL